MNTTKPPSPALAPPRAPGASPPRTGSRRRVGESLGRFSVETLAHGRLRLPDGWTHLQFRRFAGCPVCNLHLRRFAQGHAALVEAGLRTVAFFHSPARLMQPYQGDLPFAAVPDPDRHFYRLVGAEQSPFAVVHPKVMGAAVAGFFGARSNPLAGGRDQTQLPADLLLTPDGTVAAVHYGTHANDQWELDELLARFRDARARAG